MNHDTTETENTGTAARHCPYYNKVNAGDRACMRMKAEGKYLCADCKLIVREKKGEKMGDFKCNKCGKEFSTRHGLSRHMGWCGLSKKQNSELHKRQRAGKKAPWKKQRKRHPTARRQNVEVFQLTDFRIQINPDAGLDELIGLRNQIEEAIRAKL